MEVTGCEETNNKIKKIIDEKNMLNLTQMKYCVLQKENNQRLSFKWLNLV